MTESVSKLIKKKLKQVQQRNNFDPSIGAEQIRGLSEGIQRDFGRFVLLLELIKELKLDIEIPFSPDGISPGSTNTSNETFVYFIQRDSLPIWKIGFSKDPEKRCHNLQTGNDGSMWLRFKVPGGRQLEAQLKRSLSKFKTRDRNHTQKGEWFELSLDTVKKIIRYLKNNEFDYSSFKTIAS
jgi:hypothetical protein